MTVTWNSADKAASIVLSGSDLIAKQVDLGGNAGATPGKVRATEIGGTSQFFEITANTIATGAPEAVAAVGLANASASMAIALDPTNCIMWFADGWVLGPGVNTNIGTGWTAGDVIRVTSDGHFSKNGTAAYTATGLPSGSVYPVALLWANNDQVTGSFGSWGGIGGILADRNITVNQILPSIFQVLTAETGVPSDEGPPPLYGTGGFFPDTIAAILVGRTVRCDLLVFFDFTSQSMRLWQGFGTLYTNDGNAWDGIGQLGQISDLESSIGGTSPQASFTLSGVDPDIVADALNGEDEINNRDVNVYIQFFDADFNPLDNPYVIWAGLMDQFRIRQTADTCTVELSAETIFARRALPPLGNLTDREQQQLYPGDVGLALIPSLISKTAIWPVILPQA